MTQLPVDIWWIILKIVWKDKDFNPKDYNHPETPYKSSYTCKFYKTIGTSVTSDLFIMRRLCKTTKRMVDKYTIRRRSKYSQRHYLIFPYEK
jgi:hypothetical protein